MVGYARVSTEEQARDGVSLADQRRRLEAWAEANDVELLTVESENGVSGAVSPNKRPALRRALAWLERGEADGLVVLKLDRLGRSAYDVLALAERFKKEGWRLASVTETLDTSSAMGQFVLVLFAGLAEFERGQTSERTRRALEHLRSEGRATTSILPFGYRTAAHPETEAFRLVKGDRSKLVDHPEEQALLRRCFALQRRGLGAARIAARLNKAGRFNPRTGRLWVAGTLHRVLRNAERRKRLP